MASLPSPTQVAGDCYQIYESWYKKLDGKNNGMIEAPVAASFLKKSGLADNFLSRIWDASDPGGKGYLDKAGLFVALKLVALVQNGKEPSLANINILTPPPIMGEAPPQSRSPGPPLVPAPPAPSLSSSSEVWVITSADRTRYDQIFNSLGPEANKIHGNKVRGVMLNSKLPTDALGKIWDLADMDKDGSLDRAEFSIAMHLIYKTLENHPIPAALPQEMLSSARRAGVAGQGPVPAPLAPPSLQGQVSDNNKMQGPPPAPWVVSAADKARYDIMFHNADIDKDGFVSGQEIKGIFLQSGLPQLVLAHIWNICDMKQIGKLTSEQFALAMWLVQQKIAGVDPPSTLTPEMIPPTMRPKPVNEPPVMAKPTYNNPELQTVADEIDELSKDKLKLESEIQQKEASIRLKGNDIKNLQSESETLSATLKQLENQKGAAQKKLYDLGQQKGKLEEDLREFDAQMGFENEEVETLRVQVEEQETSLKAQEDEVMSKQRELSDLREQEMALEASVLTFKNKIEQICSTQQENQLYLSQVKTKMEELQDEERLMTELITTFSSSIAAQDASLLSETSLTDLHPSFLDQLFMKVGPPTPKQQSSFSPVQSPVDKTPEVNGTVEVKTEDLPKAKDTSFVGGHDPFGQAFGGTKTNSDPFASWDSKKAVAARTSGFNSDPFGGDAFASQPQETKPKKVPPRPAPPKAKPAKPPPPQINRTKMPIHDGTGWTAKPKDAVTNKNGGFADFANFSEFDSQYSSAAAAKTSPWETSSRVTSLINSTDPGFDALGGKKQVCSSSIWGTPATTSSNRAKGSRRNDTKHYRSSGDPFGGDYDPFKDTQAVKEQEEFSWEQDEADYPVELLSGDQKLSVNLGDKDPFFASGLSPMTRPRNSFAAPSAGQRSKSVLGDRGYFSHSDDRPTPKQPRSKTSLGQPRLLEMDFDPLVNRSKPDFPLSKSNEDLLNENIPFHHTESPWLSNSSDVNGKSGSPCDWFSVNNNNTLTSYNDKGSNFSDPFDLFGGSKANVYGRQKDTSVSSNQRLASALTRSSTDSQVSQVKLKSPSAGL